MTKHTGLRPAAERLCKDRLWLGVSHLLGNDEVQRYLGCNIGRRLEHSHGGLRRCAHACRQPQALHDRLTALYHNTSIDQLGRGAWPTANSTCAHYNTATALPPALLAETLHIAELCDFSLEELRYEYPEEVVPENHSANSYLRQLVTQGAAVRWPQRCTAAIQQRIEQGTYTH